MTLTEFLLARIAEDEAVAKASLATGYQPPSWGADDKPELVPDFYEPPTDEDRARVARVLAECEAKRRIVERYQTTSGIVVAEAYPGQVRMLRATVEALEEVLLDLALPYADHPDYQQEWRP